MRHTWLLALCLLLGACATHSPVPERAPQLVAALPLSLHIQREQAGEQRDWLLVLQAEGDALRWSLLDPLGMPLARQLLLDGAWHNDGLLPPNAEARELFAALLFALTPAESLSSTYPAGSWQLAADRRQFVPQWRIDYRAPLNFTLYTVAGPSYRVTTLTSPEGS